MSNIRYKTEENCKIIWLWWAERTARTPIIYQWAYITFMNSAFNPVVYIAVDIETKTNNRRK